MPFMLYRLKFAQKPLKTPGRVYDTRLYQLNLDPRKEEVHKSTEVSYKIVPQDTLAQTRFVGAQDVAPKLRNTQAFLVKETKSQARNQRLKDPPEN
ncbi:hypothetical protein QYM36_000085 [Artemia franciscana]|uniref:Uncharacterized protein n=1 Tax=Artemia franciscana TaxID=6661 RepID=A0AA88LIX7_ARTSF|nr:hypothetical protein QYM36_000085 [Artemia franciscana]